MSRRRSIEVEGLNHGAMPIPLASVVDNILISGGINGTDPATGQLSASLEEQCQTLFANVARIMAAAGGTTEDILKMTFFVKDRSSRDLINKGWLEMFPDPASRPARHTQVQDLPGGMQIQCEIYAVLQG